MTYDFSLDMISLAIGFVGGALLVLAIFMPKIARMKEGQSYMEQVFDQLAQDSLRKSQEQFLHMAEEKLKQSQKDGSYDLEKRQKAVADSGHGGWQGQPDQSNGLLRLRLWL